MGRASLVELLLAHGADADSARIDGATPLFKAAHKGHLQVCEVLLERAPNARLGILPVSARAAKLLLK